MPRAQPMTWKQSPCLAPSRCPRVAEGARCEDGAPVRRGSHQEAAALHATHVERHRHRVYRIHDRHARPVPAGARDFQLAHGGALRGVVPGHRLPGHHPQLPPPAEPQGVRDAQVARVRLRLLRRPRDPGAWLLGFPDQLRRRVALVCFQHGGAFASNAHCKGLSRLQLVSPNCVLSSRLADAGATLRRATPRSGCPATGTTTCTQTRRSTRTRRTRVSGGVTWAGSSTRRCACTPMSRLH